MIHDTSDMGISLGAHACLKPCPHADTICSERRQLDHYMRAEPYGRILYAAVAYSVCLRVRGDTGADMRGMVTCSTCQARHSRPQSRRLADLSPKEVLARKATRLRSVVSCTMLPDCQLEAQEFLRRLAYVSNVCVAL
jgi:hypothetical protein